MEEVYSMSDKMLIENWRKFLIENTRYGPASVVDISPEARKQQRGNKKWEDWVDPLSGLKTLSDDPWGDRQGDKEAEPAPIEGASAPTVAEFLQFLRNTTQREKAKGVTTDLLEFATGVITGGFEKFIQAAAKAAHDDKSIIKGDYKDNPYLAYIDFDPKYEQILKPQIFDNFLEDLPSALGTLSTDSVMPDLDELLRSYVLTNYGIPLPKVARASEDWSLVGWEYRRGGLKESKFHDNWRNFLKEEVDGFSGLSDKFAVKEWTKEYGEQIARLFISDGSYGLEMAEMSDAPPEIIEQIKEIISKVATLLDAAEKGDFGSLREPGRPQNWVREIYQGMGAIVTDLAPQNKDLLRLVDKFASPTRLSTLYDLIDHAKQAVRRTGITLQRTADSYDYVKNWVGEENTRQAVYDREQA
jgi:hypothetical protein